jgi:putative membrane protein
VQRITEILALQQARGAIATIRTQRQTYVSGGQSERTKRNHKEAITMVETSNGDPRVGLAQQRTGLAIFRTAQALDRTTLAWVRTTLTMGTFGFGMIAFFRALHEEAQTPEAARLHHAAIRFGELLVFLSIVATILAGVSHWNTLRRLERGETPRAARWPLSVVVALFVALLGMAGLWSVVQSR